MEFFEVIRRRRSIRRYKDKPVEREKILKVIEAARLAPSARNRQPWKFIIVDDGKVKEELYRVSKDQRFLLEAPVVIAMVAHPTDYVSSNGNIGHLVDLGIAGEHIVLAATALGLGSCWVVAFSQDKVKEILKAPKDSHVVALITLGYPDEVPPEKERKMMREITAINEWNGRPLE